MNKPIIRCENVIKTYGSGLAEFKALDNVNLEFNQGEIVAITGSSGSGKSTLLHLLSGLDNPSSGTCMVEGISWVFMSKEKRDWWRNQHLGIIYQNHNLIPELNVIENVALPLMIRGNNVTYSLLQAKNILSDLKMHHRLHNMPSSLSGGEKQRAAIARAIITKPKCLLADEPTGSLDSNMSFDILQIFKQLRETLGTLVIIATHDMQISSNTDRQLIMKDGRIIKDSYGNTELS